jgi:hypothetical protein
VCNCLRMCGLLVLVVLAGVALSACGSAIGPEAVARAYVDAVNANDRTQFVGLWSPDQQSSAEYIFRSIQSWQRPAWEIRSVLVRDSNYRAGNKEVTVVVASVVPGESRSGNVVLEMERLNGRWSIASGAVPILYTR